MRGEEFHMRQLFLRPLIEMQLWGNIYLVVRPFVVVTLYILGITLLERKVPSSKFQTVQMKTNSRSAYKAIDEDRAMLRTKSQKAV